MRVKKRKSANDDTVGHVPAASYNVVEEPLAAYGSSEGPFKMLNVVKDSEAYPNQKALYLSVIRGGLPRQSLDFLLEKTGLSLLEMAHILDTTDRTLRRHEGHVLLSREHSERLLEIAQLYSFGEQVFGSLDVFRQWMSAQIPALGGQQPKSFLDTSLGINIIMAEVGRIEHGVFA
ncbi:MAG TPA: antitoxin Xre/MbcA/ParS toxin-binding domain-containing protein [Phnomibacter sp.]|nr:antitoxin Xre/MbcA/ParS toxin-binding domain-containing protein [Phnomibacter sp.]